MLRDVWYLAAWGHEVSDDKLLARSIAGVPLVLFRDATGKPCALVDRCPHRFAPLHRGRLVAPGRIRCGYHGLEFGADGRCVHNPHGGVIPRAACTRAYPALERHGMIWLWFGQPEQADESRLPDFSAVDESRCFVAWRYMTVAAHYGLESDNILDLSHIQFLHPGTLGSASVQDAHTDVQQIGNTVHSRRHIEGETLTPFLEQRFGVPPGARADRWLDVRWDPPASMLQTVSIGLSGRPREQARSVSIVHVFTPESSASTHYWFASCLPRTADVDGNTWVQEHVTGLSRPFTEEDRPMVEAQQAAIGDRDFWSLQPVLLRTDAAAVRARRIHDQLLRQEREAAASSP